MKGHLMLTTASLQTRTGSGRARVQQADSYRFFIYVCYYFTYLIILGMKSNLSAFWLCYRGRDPIFSLKEPHTRSLENNIKKFVKLHSDTFDRQKVTVIFAQLKDISEQQNKPTTSWNDSIAKFSIHQPVFSQSITKSASHLTGENKLANTSERVAVCRVRSRFLLEIAGSRCLEKEALRKGGGLVVRFAYV